MPSIIEIFKEDIKELNYATARQIYGQLSNSCFNINQFQENDLSFIKSVRKNLNKRIFQCKYIQKSLEAVLFVDVNNQPLLTRQERKSFDALNEIWGDDEDGTYGEMTFNTHIQKQFPQSVV